ncbi:HSP20-like chaperone [Podospora appendiculata]|uniref:HSP20-like chaperone n=1 Tax=Podospora appendiculata TaxID=314037 RepID=A0AAE0XAY6_9PEZI|nr:HSP20-like chaperone [Podospora appendiculata]
MGKMSAYFTQHHPPRWTLPHRFAPSHEAGTTTAIPSLVPGSQAAISPSAPSDQSKPQSTDQQQQHHALGLDTLTRFLHAFHTHYGTTDDRSSDGGSGTSRIHPRFDLAESKSCYAIYADLAGLSRDDVTVEVNDQAFTLTISGVLRRPVPVLGGGQSEDPSNVDIVHRNLSAASSPPNGKGKEVDTSSVVANDNTAADEDEGRVETKTKDRGIHWHVTERQVGQFRRGFMFPPDVAEITAVDASMTNGLLCVVVPKKRGKSQEVKPEPRKVQVL